MTSAIEKIVKALLFSTAEPLSMKQLQNVFARYHEQKPSLAAEEELPEENSDHKKTPDHAQPTHDSVEAYPSIEKELPELITAAQLREAINCIADELEKGDEVIRLVQGPKGYQITTAPKYAQWVRLLRGEPPPLKLSKAAMETLAIVAYRQPVTRMDVEKIRGVSADGAINRLQEHELITVSARADLPGRPQLYATTQAFLEWCGITSLEELPASDVLSPSELDQWLHQQTGATVSDKEVGLDDTPGRFDRTSEQAQPQTQGEGADPSGNASSNSDSSSANN